MGMLSPYCHSCGWSHKSLPGKSCKQSEWHEPIDVDEELQRNHRVSAGTYVPAWIGARLRVEATKKGSTAGRLMGEILEAWATRKGGIP